MEEMLKLTTGRIFTTKFTQRLQDIPQIFLRYQDGKTTVNDLLVKVGLADNKYKWGSLHTALSTITEKDEFVASKFSVLASSDTMSMSHHSSQHSILNKQIWIRRIPLFAREHIDTINYEKKS